MTDVYEMAPGVPFFFGTGGAHISPEKKHDTGR